MHFMKAAIAYKRSLSSSSLMALSQKLSIFIPIFQPIIPDYAYALSLPIIPEIMLA